MPILGKLWAATCFEPARTPARRPCPPAWPLPSPPALPHAAADFAAEHNITCDCETIQMDQVNEAMERLVKNDGKGGRAGWKAGWKAGWMGLHGMPGDVPTGVHAAGHSGHICLCMHTCIQVPSAPCRTSALPCCLPAPPPLVLPCPCLPCCAVKYRFVIDVAGSLVA